MVVRTCTQCTNERARFLQQKYTITIIALFFDSDDLQCKVLGSVGTGGGFEGVPDPGDVGDTGFVGVADGAGALSTKS